MRLLCAEGQLRAEASADSAQLSSKRDGGDNYAAKTKAKRRKKRKKNREREKKLNLTGINMWLTLLMGSLLLLLLWDYLQKRHSCHTLHRSRITGPLSLPVLGCGLQALQLGAESEYGQASWRLSLSVASLLSSSSSCRSD